MSTEISFVLDDGTERKKWIDKEDWEHYREFKKEVHEIWMKKNGKFMYKVLLTLIETTAQQQSKCSSNE